MKLKTCKCGNSKKFKEHLIKWYDIDENGIRTGEPHTIKKFYCTKCLEESIPIDGEEIIGKN